MDIERILNESTHFKVSPAGLSFFTVDTCAECGAEVFNNGTPWLSFKGVSIAECIEESKNVYGMKEIESKYPNESYYSETNDSEECCCECECNQKEID